MRVDITDISKATNITAGCLCSVNITGGFSLLVFTVNLKQCLNVFLLKGVCEENKLKCHLDWESARKYKSDCRVNVNRF